MGMNDTPVSERVHISFFGCRNAGKSSLLNAVTGQRMAVVSAVKGTTTDPVHKTMELLPAGPVVITDTPGLDDEGALGQKRVEAALRVLYTTDVAVIVMDAAVGKSPRDEQILQTVRERKIPYIEVYNKADLIPAGSRREGLTYVSAVTGEGVIALKERIAALAAANAGEKPIVGDLVKKGDFAVLVVPIDKAAPKGRLILPQQQVIRDLLEHGAVPVVVKDSELQSVVERLGNQIALVITDSQVFGKVASILPADMPLTSFSILFSRYKGELHDQLEGVKALDSLQNGDTVLISEGCTHHRQCGDIGTVKIPALLRRYTGREVAVEVTSGKEFPEDLTKYKLIIHCGGCMLTEKEMKARIASAREQGVPITNYGMVLAIGSGILKRSIEPLGL